MFLWKIPLEVALLISEIATVKAACAASLSPFATATSTYNFYVYIVLHYFGHGQSNVNILLYFIDFWAICQVENENFKGKIF